MDRPIQLLQVSGTVDPQPTGAERGFGFCFLPAVVSVLVGCGKRARGAARHRYHMRNDLARRFLLLILLSFFSISCYSFYRV
jgi:hypothetical protein